MAEALDGNAIGGLLIEIFGQEMTTARTTCPGCGANAQLAEAVVHVRTPSPVVRCRRCTGVLMVLVDVHGITCLDSRGLAAPGPAPEPGG